MSTLRTNTLSNAAGSASVPVDTVISGSAKAWVNFNGTGTVAIRAAFNVSSITDNGTGDYTANFTTALADANFAVSGIAGSGGNLAYVSLSTTGAQLGAGFFRVNVRNGTSPLFDADTMLFSVHR
jgi:hypothetical protein